MVVAYRPAARIERSRSDNQGAKIVAVHQTLRRSLTVAVATGALILVGAGTAAAYPPPWSYQGTYNSYGECAQAAANLDQRYGLTNWECSIFAADTPERDLWVIW